MSILVEYLVFNANFCSISAISWSWGLCIYISPFYNVTFLRNNNHCILILPTICNFSYMIGYMFIKFCFIAWIISLVKLNHPVSNVSDKWKKNHRLNTSATLHFHILQLFQQVNITMYICARHAFGNNFYQLRSESKDWKAK